MTELLFCALLVLSIIWLVGWTGLVYRIHQLQRQLYRLNRAVSRTLGRNLEATQRLEDQEKTLMQVSSRLARLEINTNPPAFLRRQAD